MPIYRTEELTFHLADYEDEGGRRTVLYGRSGAEDVYVLVPQEVTVGSDTLNRHQRLRLALVKLDTNDALRASVLKGEVAGPPAEPKDLLSVVNAVEATPRKFSKTPNAADFTE